MKEDVQKSVEEVDAKAAAEAVKKEIEKSLTVDVDAEAIQHNEMIDGIIGKIKENQFKFYFFAPNMNTPSGGVAVLLKLARILSDQGMNTIILYEPKINQQASYQKSQEKKKQIEVYDKFNPAWIDFSLEGIEFEPMGDGKKVLTFSDDTKQVAEVVQVMPEDFIIIPEGFPNVMKKFAQINCQKIVLAQSWFYILNALNSGETWQQFGISDVITVSDAITEYLMAIMPGLNIKQFSQSIDRGLFKPPAKLTEKFPIVGFMASRGPENKLKTYNIIKTFQSFYPHLRWVRFVELAGLSKEEFADRLASCAFILYTDDIAGFGTLPLEAMACNTHVVGWNVYGGKEYVTPTNGNWTVNNDLFQTAEVLGVVIDKWLNGEFDHPAITEEYEKTLSRYTVEGEKTDFLKIINEYKNKRINELEKFKK